MTWDLTIDGTKVTVAGREFVYRQSAADHVCKFFELFLTHTSGKHAGKPFLLEPWQRWYLSELFGWRCVGDDTRRYRKTLLFVPRKNGKTTLQAGIGLYLLCADGEMGAQVYAAAADREQAAICFGMARKMMEQSKELSRIVKPFKYSLVHDESGSSFKAISSDGETKHGYSSHGNLIDELHCHKKRELYDALTTSTGARSQPLTMITTTAGVGKKSLCYEVYTYAKNVRDGVVEDPEFLPMIFEAPESADWKDPETWRACNPNMGQTFSERYLEQACKEAQAIPGLENTFKRLHLNLWTEQADRWISLESWDLCAGDGEPLRVEECEGRSAYVGLDLASVGDLTAMVAVLPVASADEGEPIFDVLCHFWCPAESIKARSEREQVPYDVWANQGFIEPTVGRSVDQRRIFEVIMDWARLLDVHEWAIDPWNAKQLVQQMAEADMQVVEHRQGFISMNSPSKEFQRCVLDGRLRHGGHPVLRWMAGNVAVESDAAGNIKPSKALATEKIDGITSLVMAVGRACVHDEHAGEYNGSGLRFV